MPTASPPRLWSRLPLWEPWTDLAGIARQFGEHDDTPLGAPTAAPDANGVTFHHSWIQFIPLGEYRHPEYGDLHFTYAKLCEFKQKFDDHVRGIDIALDTDHETGPAPGWVERMVVHSQDHTGDPALVGKPGGLYAYIRWTPLGVDLLKEQRYRYFSPEFGPHFDEITGQKIPDVILGGALTNRPFLKTMDAIALKERQRSRVRLADTSTTPWHSVNKSTLPDSAFLDPTHRRLPVYEGAGPKDAKGRYTQRGPLNLNGVKAAWAAINGAHTGTPMSGLPAGVRAKLAAWRKQYLHLQDPGDSALSEPVAHPRAAQPTRRIPAPRSVPMSRKTPVRARAQQSRQASRSGEVLDEAEFLAEESRLVARGPARGGTPVRRAPATLEEIVYSTSRFDDDSESYDDTPDGSGAPDGESDLYDDNSDDSSDSFDDSDDNIAAMDDDAAELDDDSESYDDAGEDDLVDNSVDDGKSASPAEVAAKSNRHSAVTTPKSGHKHGKYGLHTHFDDADHSDAPMAEDDLMEPAPKGAVKPAQVAMREFPIAGMQHLLSDDDDAPVTLEEGRTLRQAVRLLAEEQMRLRDAAYRADVSRLSEAFARTLRLSDKPDGKPGEKRTIAPSRVFRGYFEDLMLSEDVRRMSDTGRAQLLKVIEAAYIRGAVITGQVSLAEPGKDAPTPPMRLGARTAHPSRAGKNIVLEAAEGLAQQRFNKTFNEVPHGERIPLLNEAARLTNYQGG